MPYTSSLSSYMFLSMSSLFMFSDIAFIKSVLGNNFGRNAKDGVVKVDTVVVRYEEKNGRPNVVASERISGAGVSD